MFEAGACGYGGALLIPAMEFPTPIHAQSLYLLTLSSVLIISNVVTITVPPDAAALGFFHRVQQGLHADRVCGVRLHEIDNVEPVYAILPRVGDLEVIPLREPSRGIVVFKVQIVLIFAPIIVFYGNTAYTLTALFRFPLSKRLSKTNVLS